MTSPMYDIIFAGGGTTACVVAGRLAAADPSLKILIVEKGQHTRDVPTHSRPSEFVTHLSPNSTTMTFHIGKPSAHLNGRGLVTGTGRALGGGSTVNFMLYTRGSASDYDDWAAFGNKGWSFEELLPLFRKLETFPPTILDRTTHGDSGPIPIAPVGEHFGFGKQVLSVAEQYNPGRPLVDDDNDFKTTNGYAPCYRYVDPATGRRSDAASRYLYPQTGNLNLEIVVGKNVKRVIIENGRAVGIEYTAADKTGSSELVTARASKWVVLSAGAFGSPAILERSGIGASTILGKFDIPVVVDLPGVGENYHDHPGGGPGYRVSDDTETMSEIWSNREVFNSRLKEWEEKGTGKIATNGMEVMIKVRPTAEERASAGSAFKSRWETFFERHPDKAMSIAIAYAGHPKAIAEKLVCSAYFLLYPDFTGRVHITSAQDPESPLDFDPNFCSKLCDLEQFTLMYKMTRELFRRLPSYRGEFAPFHPQFPAGSAATCKDADGPVPVDAPKIVYTEADDQAIINYHRNSAFTFYHSLGTCAMKPRGQGGVVDARLNVYGVQGLKVADLSICPSNVGNNTYSTALVVGEKAAEILAEDLGVKL